MIAALFRPVYKVPLDTAAAAFRQLVREVYFCGLPPGACLLACQAITLADSLHPAAVTAGDHWLSVVPQQATGFGAACIDSICILRRDSKLCRCILHDKQ